jgi:hypothetical protein
MAMAFASITETGNAVKKHRKPTKDSRSSDRYVGNQFMIDKVMKAAHAAPRSTAAPSSYEQRDKRQVAQAKRERRMEKRKHAEQE